MFRIDSIDFADKKATMEKLRAKKKKKKKKKKLKFFFLKKNCFVVFLIWVYIK